MHILYNFFGAMIFCILTVQGAQQCLIKSLNEQVNDLVLVFVDHSRFSHEDLMDLGLICKSNHEYLCATAERRKNYFRKLMPMAETRCNSFQWHGYGSRADRKIVVRDDFSFVTKKALTLERLELSGNHKIRTYYGSWSNFKSELFHKPTPFYNEEKQVCFIGIGWIHGHMYNSCGDILCYQALNKSDFKDITSFYKSSEIKLRCLLQFNSEGLNQYKLLVALSDFPYLLKALLNSKQIKKESIDTFQGDFLTFNLDGVTLPNNYKEYILCTGSCNSYCSFDELSHDLRYALEKRYEEQQKSNHS